jgi:hypothetical protein
VTIIYRCDGCEETFELREGHNPPVDWFATADARDGWLERTDYHACSPSCLAEVAMRLALGEQCTPEVAPEPKMVTARKPRARKST